MMYIFVHRMGHKSLMQSGTKLKVMNANLVNVNITVVKNNEIYDNVGTIDNIVREIEKNSDSLFVYEGLEYNPDELIDVLTNFINQ